MPPKDPPTTLSITIRRSTGPISELDTTVNLRTGDTYHTGCKMNPSFYESHLDKMLRITQGFKSAGMLEEKVGELLDWAKTALQGARKNGQETLADEYAKKFGALGLYPENNIHVVK